jgi:hypothetical protein
MNHKKMWDALKTHYEKRVKTFEEQGRAKDHPCLHAKNTLTIMEFFEASEGENK